ncbi:hypothetical protein [Nocardioides sp.]|uniref:hypothetical protein n=1 Tax=Nocardioides sp. TaxID=35761 RepID=UPI002CA82547|nr:hypothetical protein [Nocardioides sp.]HSX67220.1 hypothetical protein [Nocardioides sp.]
MKNQTAIIVGVVAMFCTTMFGVVVVAVFAPSEQAANTIGLILTALSTTVVGVLALAKIGSVEKTVDELSNGLMDSKLRAGIADVLPDHLVDPKARPQLEQDRIRRDSRH